MTFWVAKIYEPKTTRRPTRRRRTSSCLEKHRKIKTIFFFFFFFFKFKSTLNAKTHLLRCKHLRKKPETTGLILRFADILQIKSALKLKLMSRLRARALIDDFKAIFVFQTFNFFFAHNRFAKQNKKETNLKLKYRPDTLLPSELVVRIAWQN